MRPLLLGHRGHRMKVWGEEENTLAAFDRALAAGCDGLELDLRLTGDGRIVIHHDARLSRDGEAIADNSLRSLRRLRPDLMTLEQVLRRYRGRAWLDLEIKAAAVVPELGAVLRRLPPQRGYVVSSFALATLRQVGTAVPEAELCLNLRRPQRLRRLREAGVGWIAPNHASCTGWYVRRLRAAGWRVLVWTVNRRLQMRTLARAQVEAVVSDDPALLVQTLGGKQTR